MSWSVRGIYKGYVGWFDGNPATMYQIPPPDTYPDLVELAGGPDRIAQRAAELWVVVNRFGWRPVSRTPCLAATLCDFRDGLIESGSESSLLGMEVVFALGS